MASTLLDTPRTSWYLSGYYAPVAQSVEHIHGKDGVIGSSPIGGSRVRFKQELYL